LTKYQYIHKNRNRHPNQFVLYLNKRRIMVRLSKIYRILISSLLAFLGFSCGNGGGGNNEWNSYPAAYGTPTATYKAKGVVVSEADDFPIKGIKTVLKNEWQDDEWSIASAYTNNDGAFVMEGSEFPRQKLYVKLIDVDGEENGLFSEMEIEADYTNATFTGGGAWFEGEAEIDLGTIKMKPETKDENKD
jgi:putative lipoprotein (rSAM/lipoprotein system)